MKKRWIFLYFMLLMTLIVLASMKQYARNEMVEMDPLRKTDAMVLLIGDPIQRAPAAIEYYHQGLSPMILFREVVPKEHEPIPEHVELVQILEGADIPSEAIQVLDKRVNSTLDEAMCICDYIRSQEDISSILLVTSKYHSGRAKRIFEEAFRQADLPVTVVSAPTSHDSFSQEEW